MDVTLEIPGTWSALASFAAVSMESRPPRAGVREEYRHLSGDQLLDIDLATLDAHERIVCLGVAAPSVEAARALLDAAGELVRTGGAAVKVVSAESLYSAREWLELAERRSADALFYAFVRLEEAGTEARSHGMEAFGLKDATLIAAPGDRDPAAKLEMFLLESFRRRWDVRAGDTFSSLPPYGTQVYRIEDFHGRWRLSAAPPIEVLGLLGVIAVAAGSAHSLAVMADGSVTAWGSLPTGPWLPSSVSDRTPAPVKGLLGPAVAVAAGGLHSLILLEDGRVMASGENRDGQLGVAERRDSTIALLVSDLTDVVAISAGLDHSLALTADGAVYAWGGNVQGQLGDGTRIGRSHPELVTGLTGPARAIAAGGQQSAVLLADGSVARWGYIPMNEGPAREWDLTPRTLDLGAPAVAIAAGSHVLAVLADGAVAAWGANFLGQLGDGTRLAALVPGRVKDLPRRTVSVAAGNSHSVALLDDGGVVTWGHPFDRPTLVALHDVVAVSAGASHSVALKADGTVAAWGANFGGQLGAARHHEGPSLADIEPRPLPPRTLASLQALRTLSVRLKGAPGRPVRVGGTKLGGRPDLPPDLPWPSVDGIPQAFVGQIDLANVATAARALQPESDGSGLLVFFCDSAFRVSNDDHEEMPCHVALFPTGSTLAPRTAPDDVGEEWSLQELALQGEAEMMDVPVTAWEVERLGLTPAEHAAWWRGEEADSPRHRMFGYPEPIQNEPRRWTDETLLLQVDADPDAGMDWGDCGRLSYLIRREDLAASRFDHVRLVYQCH